MCAELQRSDFEDLEIVVVDDASTDSTASTLAAIDEPRMRVITHPVNRGISPARATTAEHARGQWVVIIDSDWELFPGSLDRLRVLIDELPPGVRIIRTRLGWDNGAISPPVVPDGVTDYQGRLSWLEAIAQIGGGSDAAHCIHRDVLAERQLPSDRRGAVETLWETDVSRTEPSLWVPDVIAIEHLDAANSVTRDSSPRRLIPRLLSEAPDQRWMAETMLAQHGAGLKQLRRPTAAGYWKAHPWSHCCAVIAGRGSSISARLGGPVLRDCSSGRHSRWGCLGPRPLARAKLVGRHWRSRRTRTVSGAG